MLGRRNIFMSQTRIIIRSLRLTDAQDIHERMHVFVAEIQGKVAGVINLNAGTGRKSHVGEITMAIHDKHQGQGIGKMLMLTALDLADNWLNLVRLEMDVYTDNERALRLYK